jgi:hypothetical protein
VNVPHSSIDALLTETMGEIIPGGRIFLSGFHVLGRLRTRTDEFITSIFAPHISKIHRAPISKSMSTGRRALQLGG